MVVALSRATAGAQVDDRGLGSDADEAGGVGEVFAVGDAGGGGAVVVAEVGVFVDAAFDDGDGATVAPWFPATRNRPALKGSAELVATAAKARSCRR